MASDFDEFIAELEFWMAHDCGEEYCHCDGPDTFEIRLGSAAPEVAE